MLYNKIINRISLKACNHKILCLIISWKSLQSNKFYWLASDDKWVLVNDVLKLAMMGQHGDNLLQIDIYISLPTLMTVETWYYRA